jgi:hypothetical protein
MGITSRHPYQALVVSCVAATVIGCAGTVRNKQAATHGDGGAAGSAASARPTGNHSGGVDAAGPSRFDGGSSAGHGGAGTNAGGSGGGAGGMGSSAADAGGAGGAGGSGTGTADADAGGSAVVRGVSPCDPKVAFFCDDFENGTEGNKPQSPWDQNDAVKITTARAWSGTKAVDIAEGFSTLNLDLKPARDVLFVRFLLWTSFDGSTPDSRLSVVAATSGSDTAATDANPNLVSFHHYSGGESALESTTALPPSQWACLEASYDRTSGIFRAWVNGQEAMELNQPVGGPAIAGAWTNVAIQNLVVHGGTGATTTMVDDVALGTGRIGCPTMK